MGVERLKMVAPISKSYTGELEEYIWSKIMDLVAEMAVKTRRGHPSLPKTQRQ
jgi:hypothetical protein